MTHQTSFKGCKFSRLEGRNGSSYTKRKVFSTDPSVLPSLLRKTLGQLGQAGEQKVLAACLFVNHKAGEEVEAKGLMELGGWGDIAPGFGHSW